MPERDISTERLAARLDELEAETQRYLETSADSDQAVELDQTRQGRLSRMDAMQGPGDEPGRPQPCQPTAQADRGDPRAARKP